MKKKSLVFFILFLCAIFNVPAQETVKVMFYNLLNYPLEDAVPNRDADLAYILADYQPDMFLVCELNNLAGALDILNITQTEISSDFQMANFIANTSDDLNGNQNDLQNMFFYNSSKFSLEEQIIVPTYLRDFNVYRIKLNTVNQDTDPIEIYVIVCHLKASSGTYNAQKRFEMVLDLQDFLNTLPADTNILLGGDLNVYTASEPAFQTLLSDSNNIALIDPANRIGNWHNNSSYIDVFSQSTRTQSGMGGASGGFDDRFDFILTSENMINNSNITYVPESYQSYGNNELESCRNRAINSTDCGTADSPFSYELRNAIHNFSDHLPVTLSLETEATFLSVHDFTPSNRFALESTIINKNLILTIEASELYNHGLFIYNNLGQMVKSVQLNSDVTQQINVSDLSNGMYFLNVSNSNTNPIKFIVSN